MNLGLAGLHDRKQNWDVRRPILLVVAVMACSTSGLDRRKSQQQGTESAAAVSEPAAAEATLMEQAEMEHALPVSSVPTAFLFYWLRVAVNHHQATDPWLLLAPWKGRWNGDGDDGVVGRAGKKWMGGKEAGGRGRKMAEGAGKSRALAKSPSSRAPMVALRTGSRMKRFPPPINGCFTQLPMLGK